MDWILFGFCVAACGLLVYSVFVERFWLEVRKVEVSLPKQSPTFQGMKIAVFSDIHFGFFYTTNHLKKAVDLISSLHPDLICFTGDLVESKKSLQYLQSMIPILSKLECTFGKYVRANSMHSPRS